MTASKECRAHSLEPLPHQVRAFVKNKEGMAKQELNQSPLPFVESAAQPGGLPLPSLLLLKASWLLKHTPGIISASSC